MRKQYIVDALNTPVDFQHFTPSMMLSRGRRVRAGTPRRRELDDPIARECDEDEHANDTGT